jgi:molecular chaperone DnaK (HSP70)
MSDELKKQRVEPSSRARSGAPVEIIIGIDYGTCFTKVAIGREGQEPIVWTDPGGTALIPSIVHITTNGEVWPWPNGAPAGAMKIEYLKMLLAKPHESIFDLPSAALVGQKREDVVKASAALFLAEIIRRARASEHEKPHLRKANIRWLVNIGVPVEL